MIEVDFFVFSEGEIKEFVFICQFAREPIQISGILIFVALIASLVFYDNDKVDLLVENNFFTFKTFYHVSSLFVRQKKFRRLSAVFEVLSTMLVIMAVVGISIQRIDSEVSRLELDFRSFTVEAFGSGILALCCSQVLTVVNFILKYFRYSNERLDSHLIVFNFTISIIAFIAICCICASYCIGQVVDWMVNFLIFTVVQMFILEPVYSAVVYLVCKKRQIDKGKRVTMPSEVTDSKVFRVINTSGFTLQETPTNRSLIKTSPRILFD
jgi:Mn2+/Fe2+ NRAMP family transporter